MSERARLRQAIKNYKRLLALEPRHLEHLRQLALLLVEVGKPKDAAQYLTTRARVLSDLGAFEAAEADCQAALSLNKRARASRVLMEELEQRRLQREAAAQAAALTTQQRMRALQPQLRGPTAPQPTAALTTPVPLTTRTRTQSLSGVEALRPGERVVDATELLVAKTPTPRPAAPEPERVYDASELLAVRSGPSILESIDQSASSFNAQRPASLNTPRPQARTPTPRPQLHTPTPRPQAATRTVGFEEANPQSFGVGAPIEELGRPTLKAPPPEAMIRTAGFDEPTRTTGFDEAPTWKRRPASLAPAGAPAPQGRTRGDLDSPRKSRHVTSEGILPISNAQLSESIEAERRSIEASIEMERAALEAEQARWEAEQAQARAQASLERRAIQESIDRGVESLDGGIVTLSSVDIEPASRPPSPASGPLPHIFSVGPKPLSAYAPPLERDPTPSSFGLPPPVDETRPETGPLPPPINESSLFDVPVFDASLVDSNGYGERTLEGPEHSTDITVAHDTRRRSRPTTSGIPTPAPSEPTPRPRGHSSPSAFQSQPRGTILSYTTGSFSTEDALIGADLDDETQVYQALSSFGPTGKPITVRPEQVEAELSIDPITNEVRTVDSSAEDREWEEAFGAFLEDPPSVSSRVELRFPLLETLPKREMEAMLNSARVTRFMAGEIIVEEGKPFDGVYLLMEGLIRVQFNGINGPTFAAGAIFGLLETFFGGPWNQKLITDYPSELFQIPKRRFEQILRQFPRLERSLREEAERRQLISLLAKSPLFRSLSAHSMSALAARCHPRVFSTGEALFEEAGIGGLYLIVKGRVELSDAEGVLANFKSGDCVGLRSALKIPLLGAEARALEPTEVQHIPRAEIDHLLRDPNVRLAFEQAVKIRR